jgi:hypothetical protein
MKSSTLDAPSGQMPADQAAADASAAGNTRLTALTDTLADLAPFIAEIVTGILGC